MPQSSFDIFLRFLRFGCLAWGGPVAQIAMIKKELVEEEQWVSKEEFNRALALYQVLPGPEAHELCVYFGMKAGGRIGGLLAGLGFMLPGFFLMLFFTWIYVRYGVQSPSVQAVFSGIQAAVIALIVFAVYRIGKHAVVNTKLLTIAIFSAIAFLSGVHFLIVLLAAGLAYSFWQKKKTNMVILLAVLLTLTTGFTIYKEGWRIENTKRTVSTTASNNITSQGEVFLTGLKGGLLTFGGAYTAIPFMQQDAVEKKGWMTQEQFLDGIALSGILPAPLIIFSTFVGYFGGGWLGAVLITIGIFLPAFTFTLAGHSAMEKLIANAGLHNFLDGVTASVVGLIGITATRLLFATIDDLPAIFIFLVSLFVLIRYRSKYLAMFIIAAAGLFGFAWRFFV